MKHLLLLTTVLLCLAVSGQQVAKSIPVSANEIIGFYEYKPTDYDSEDQSIKHPLIIFLHGGGEKGNGTTELSKVATNGIPTNIKNGHNMRFTWNGKTETFIVLSPQLNGTKYGWWYDFITDSLISYATRNLRIDTNRIILTGLSMGGGGTWAYAGGKLSQAQKLAAIGISCGACQDVNWCNIANANLPTWAFHAEDDNSTAPVGCTKSTINKINDCKPAVVPYATYWATGGHGIWGRVYSTDYSYQNPNIYEWFLGQDKSKPVNKRPLANAGPDMTISTTTGSVNLSGAKSKDEDGKLVRYIWRKVSGPTGGAISIPVSEDGVTRVTGLTTPGTYQFELKAVDDRADWSFDQVNITVVNGSAPNVPPVTQAGTDQTVIYPEADLNGTKSYDPDGTVVAYNWRKVDGPEVYTLSGASTSQPIVKDMLIGVYKFELEATDNMGARTKDTVTINATATILPVSLLYFRAAANGQQTQLVWGTENEDGFELYEVEASTNSVDFSTVASIQGSERPAGQQNYSWTDTRGYPYYRLKITARSSRIRYSAIVRVDRQAAAISLEFFPNPVQHQLSVLLNDPEKGVLRARLFSMDGKLARQQQWNKNQELMAVSMDTRGLTTGIYFLEVTLGNRKKEVRKIVKQ
ncbi:MAG: PKD domain-containing protein [Candidatus Pseudobacter hemicellulosilyticus]|uniref:PKD domain-containing protein n=1 Tax=Candidatus Pseudobacter hemicellulosilyticus TaxID=3121375 RepID=A0AAJ6BJT0_9BACT|nr:MAG: PKD domain-containing protein [Pseudobacter sp.]